MGPIQMGTHIAFASHHVLLYVVVPHGCHARDGWDLFQREPTVAYVSRHVLPHMDVPHFLYVRQASTSFQKEHVRGWTLSMQRLNAWIPFLYQTVMHVDAYVTCWHGRFFLCRYITARH
jgi:hypothetical protein